MRDLTEGKVSKRILNFAVPMLLGNVFQQFYNIVDSIIVGNYIGKEALAAVGASFPIIFAFISMIIGISMGGTIIISQYFGAKDINKVKRTIDTLFIFLFFAAILMTVLGIFASESIFVLTDLPEDILPQAKKYLSIYFSGLIFFFGFNGVSAVLRGLGDSKTPLYFLIMSTIFNIGFDILFVVVFKWGIEGVAYATVLSQGGAFLTAVIYLNKTHKVIRVSFFNLTFDKDIFIKSLRIGLPSGFQHTFVALGMIALFWIVNQFGTDVIAAYAVAGRIDSVALMFAMNFSAALSTFVGQNLGANKPDRVRVGFMATLKMSSIVSILLTVFILLFRTSLIGIFIKGSEPEVIAYGEDYLIIVSSCYLIFSTMFIINGVLRGAGDTIIPMFITLMALWGIRIPLAYFLSGKYGVQGIWWAIPIAWFAGMVMSYIYYLTGRWRKKVIVKYETQ